VDSEILKKGFSANVDTIFSIYKVCLSNSNKLEFPNVDYKCDNVMHVHYCLLDMNQLI
jgi:hypothetical protein